MTFWKRKTVEAVKRSMVARASEGGRKEGIIRVVKLSYMIL